METYIKPNMEIVLLSSHAIATEEDYDVDGGFMNFPGHGGTGNASAGC